MADIDTIRSNVRSLKGWKLFAFATACAEHGAPVFRFLASPDSTRRFGLILESIWGELADSQQPRGRLRAVRAMPECRIDDSHRRDFYASCALELLEHALQLSTSDDPHDEADIVCCLTLDLYSSFEGIAAHAVAKNPPVPLPKSARELGEYEAAAQAACLQILNGNIDRRELCQSLRSCAKESAQILENLLPTLIRARYGA